LLPAVRAGKGVFDHRKSTEALGRSNGWIETGGLLLPVPVFCAGRHLLFGSINVPYEYHSAPISPVVFVGMSPF
jgi:hypothetical protein